MGLSLPEISVSSLQEDMLTAMTADIMYCRPNYRRNSAKLYVYVSSSSLRYSYLR